MKDQDIRYGNLEAGGFQISIQPCIAERGTASDALYFEVMVSDRTKGYPIYVHLVDDPRFSWFPYGKFERTIRADEVLEYNTYLLRKHQTQPVWKLSRASILILVELCERHTPKKKKAPKTEQPAAV